VTRYAPLWEQALTYPASVDRRLMGALWPSGAVSGCAVSVGSAMTVNVAAGTCAVPAANNTGTVLCVSDAVEAVTLAAAGASGTNRYDLVVCQSRGNDLDGGANNDFIFTNVTGTGAGSPVPPAVPAGALILAQIYVPGGSASVTAGNITDLRSGPLAAPVVQTFAVRRLFQAQMDITNTANTNTLLNNTADRTALQLAFTKRYTATKLVFRVAGTAVLSTGAGSWMLIGMTPNALANVADCAFYPIGTPPARGAMVGMNEIGFGVLPAGIYTIQPYIRTGSGGIMTFQAPVLDQLTYDVTETF
jgi:hypothetical protein